MTRENVSYYDKLYSNVSPDLRNKFKEFRTQNPYKKIKTDDVIWNYISCGKGKKSILFLTGGSSIGDGWAFHIMAFENDYRCISVDYPAVSDMRSLTKGIADILNTEGIDKVHIIGQSFGGIVGPCFAHHYPEKVDKLVLSHTIANLNSFDRIEREARIKKMEKSVKILRLIPKWILYRVSLRRMKKHFNDLDKKDSEFLKTFFTETIKYRTTKKQIIASYLVMIDYMKNYILSADDFSNWTGKVFIFDSESDKAIKTEEKQSLKSLFKNAKVYTFEGEGTSHLSLFSKREEFISLVKEFFTEEDINIKNLENTSLS